MKRDVQCRLCNMTLGRLESHQAGIAITNHFRVKHPQEYADIKKAYDHYKFLRSIYKFDGGVS